MGVGGVVQIFEEEDHLSNVIVWTADHINKTLKSI